MKSSKDVKSPGLNAHGDKLISTTQRTVRLLVLCIGICIYINTKKKTGFENVMSEKLKHSRRVSFNCVAFIAIIFNWSFIKASAASAQCS